MPCNIFGCWRYIYCGISHILKKEKYLLYFLLLLGSKRKSIQNIFFIELCRKKNKFRKCFFFSFLIVIPPSTNLKLKCIFSRYVRILFNVGNSFSSNFFDMTLLLKTFLLFKYTETYFWIFVTK